jgi:hypothetical protein
MIQSGKVVVDVATVDELERAVAGAVARTETIRAGVGKLGNAFENEFPGVVLPERSTEYPDGMTPVDAALETLRALYPVAQFVMRGDISQAVLTCAKVFPNGPDNTPSKRQVAAVSVVSLPPELRKMAEAADDELKGFCNRLLHIAASPGDPGVKQQQVNAAMLRFMGIHSRFMQAMLRARLSEG